VRRLLDPTSPGSLSHRLRGQRFSRFEALAATLPRPLRLIDLGGTNDFWEQVGWAGRDDVRVTLVNLDPLPRVHENVEPVVGDVTSLSGHADGSFDVAFSNSVIEHLFTRERQRAMANEVRRVGRAYWVQTPNYWFPVEPHFVFPAWQWLPRGLRVAALRRRGFGWTPRLPDREAAERAVDEIRLLRRRELAGLFPEAGILAERFAGLPKSWIAVYGFGAIASG
jgi:Methyltransferase domain